MKEKSEIIGNFIVDRAKLIAQKDPSSFSMGWVQALAWVLDQDCPP